MQNRKTIFGWTMYDWANSAFATSVMAGFFPIFFKQYWSAGADPIVSTARLGLANSIAGIVVALIAPILGAIADKGNSKKRFLIYFAYLGVAMTAALSLVSKGNWPLAAGLFVCATIGFSGSNIFYDAFITTVAPKNREDFISALGFSLGYLGGGLLFAFNVWMTLSPTTFGFADTGEAVHFSFLLVGIWWAVFTIPLILFVSEPKGDDTASEVNMITAGFHQLRDTFREICHLKTISLFLIAYWLYIDGVDTIIRMAVDYGMSIGLATTDLIQALLITQFVGFPATIGFGYLGGKIGAQRAILMVIIIYFFISIWAAFLDTQQEFYTLAVIIGLTLGGIQALSRSLYARIIPSDKSAEYFGFYNMLGKFAAVIGPVLIGGVGLLVRHLGYSSNLASRVSIASISILFIAGGILFSFVDEEKGKQEAQYLSQN